MVLLLGVLVGGVTPAGASFSDEVDRVMSSFGTASKGGAGTKAHDERMHQREQDRLAARVQERIEQHAAQIAEERRRKRSEKAQAEAVAEAQQPAQTPEQVDQTPEHTPSVEATPETTTTTEAVSTATASEGLDEASFKKGDAEARAWAAKPPGAKAAQIQNEVDAMVAEIAEAAEMDTGDETKDATAQPTLAQGPAKTQEQQPVEQKPEQKPAAAAATEQSDATHNAETEAIRAKLDAATAAAVNARAEAQEAHQKLLDFKAKHAEALADASVAAKVEGVAVGVKLGQRKASEREKAEKTHFAAMEQKRNEEAGERIAQAEEQVAAVESKAHAAEMQREDAEARANDLVAQLHAIKPSRKWQIKHKWEDANTQGKSVTMDTSGALGQDSETVAAPGDEAVWVTAQVPTNSGNMDVRDHLLPELAAIAAWGGTGVVEGDFALVRSHFVLIGGIILPHPTGNPGETALVNIDLVCDGLAVDLKVPRDNLHCYRNGTVTPPAPSPPAPKEIDDEQAYEHALDDKQLAVELANQNANSVVPTVQYDPVDTTSTQGSDYTANSEQWELSYEERSYENMLSGSEFTEQMQIPKLGDSAAFDPNVPRDGDYTFTETSLPDDTRGVSGEVVVFIVTGFHDQSDFIDVVSRVDLSQYSTNAEFKTTESMTGGKLPVLQFARHHARLTYAIAVNDPDTRDAVVERFRDPEAQKYLSNAMGGRSLLRDVKVKKEPVVAFVNNQTHVASDVTEVRTEQIWNEWGTDVNDETAAIGQPRNGGHDQRDVWTTFQVPYVPVNTSYLSLHDRLFPAVVEATRAHGKTQVTEQQVAYVRSRFVTLAALAMPAHALDAVGVDGVCAALAADLLVPNDFIDCFANGTVTVPAQGPAVNLHLGNHSWVSLAFSVHGLTSESRFSGMIEKIKPNKETHELEHFQTVAAMCGSNVPALLNQEHHAFVTYAVAVNDRVEGNIVIGALATDEAAQFTANVLRVPSVSIRDVVYKMPPKDVEFGDELAPKDMWFKPGQEVGTEEVGTEVLPSPVPASPEAPPAPPHPPSPYVAPMGALREVFVTLAAPTNAVSSNGEDEDEIEHSDKLDTVLSAIARAVDRQPDPPFINGYIDTHRDVELDVVAFQFAATVDGVDLHGVDVDVLCDAIAADLGAPVEMSRCHLEDPEHPASLGGSDVTLFAEAEVNRVRRRKFRRHLRRFERKEKELQAADADRLFTEQLASLGAEITPSTRMVIIVNEVPDRVALDAMTETAHGKDFPTASAVCDGGELTLKVTTSRAEVTFGLWTTSQQVATTVARAFGDDDAIAQLTKDVGGTVEVRDVFIDQRPGHDANDPLDEEEMAFYEEQLHDEVHQQPTTESEIEVLERLQKEKPDVPMAELVKEADAIVAAEVEVVHHEERPTTESEIEVLERLQKEKPDVPMAELVEEADAIVAAEVEAFIAPGPAPAPANAPAEAVIEALHREETLRAVLDHLTHELDDAHTETTRAMAMAPGYAPAYAPAPGPSSGAYAPAPGPTSGAYAPAPGPSGPRAASLGSTHKASKKYHDEPDSSAEIWTTVQVPLLNGKDPHAYALELSESLENAVKHVNEKTTKGSRLVSGKKTEETETSSVRYVGASYVVVASVTVPGFPVKVDGPVSHLGLGAELHNTGITSMDQVCAAIAVDLGVPKSEASCRFNGTAALGGNDASHFSSGVTYHPSASLGSSHKKSHKKSKYHEDEFEVLIPHFNLGQQILLLADVGGDLAKARAAAEKARPGPSSFQTVKALIGTPVISSAAETEKASVPSLGVFVPTASYARVDAFFAYIVPVADAAALLTTTHALSTTQVDDEVSKVAIARAVVRAADTEPSPSDIAALDPAPVVLPSGLEESKVVVPKYLQKKSDDLDASIFMQDTPLFERDVPGKKGKQGKLGGINKFDETKVEQMTNAAQVALRQAKARTAKAQLLKLHRESPRLADLGEGMGVKGGHSFEMGSGFAVFALAATALVAAALSKQKHVAAPEERIPLVPKNADGEVAVAV